MNICNRASAHWVPAGLKSSAGWPAAACPPSRTHQSILLVIIAAGLLVGMCPVASAQQELVKKVEDDMRTGASPVHDFGHFLKPGGVVELKQEADRLKAGD